MDRAPQVILVVAVVAIIHLKSNLFLGLGYEKRVACESQATLLQLTINKTTRSYNEKNTFGNNDNVCGGIWGVLS